MCGEWFHGDCVGISEDEGDGMDIFVCDSCEKSKLIQCDDDEVLAKKINTSYKQKKTTTKSIPKPSKKSSSSKSAVDTDAKHSVKKTSPMPTPASAQQQIQESDHEALLLKKKEMERMAQTRATVQQQITRALNTATVRDGDGDARQDNNRISSDELAKSIEEHLFQHYANSVGKEYKTKVRTLYFNLSDKNNQELRQNVLHGNIAVKNLITMTPEELANTSLKKMRKERAEMVEKMVVIESQAGNAGANGAVAGMMWKKTHKGDELVKIKSDDYDGDFVYASDLERRDEQGNELSPSARDAHHPLQTTDQHSSLVNYDTSSTMAMNSSSHPNVKVVNSTSIVDNNGGNDGLVETTGNDDGDKLVIRDAEDNDNEDDNMKSSNEREKNDNERDDVVVDEVDLNFPCFESFEDFKEKNKDFTSATLTQEETLDLVHKDREALFAAPVSSVAVTKTPSTLEAEHENSANFIIWSGSLKCVLPISSSAGESEYTTTIVISVNSSKSKQNLLHICFPSSLDVVGRLSCSKVSDFVKQVQTSSRSRSVCIGNVSEVGVSDSQRNSEQHGHNDSTKIGVLAKLTGSIIKTKKAAVLLRTDNAEIYFVLKSDLNELVDNSDDNNDVDTNECQSDLCVVIIYKLDKSSKHHKNIRSKNSGETHRSANAATKKRERSPSKDPNSTVDTTTKRSKSKVESLTTNIADDQSGSKKEDISSSPRVESTPTKPTASAIPQLQSLHQLHDFLSSMSGTGTGTGTSNLNIARSVSDEGKGNDAGLPSYQSSGLNDDPRGNHAHYQQQQQQQQQHFMQQPPLQQRSHQQVASVQSVGQERRNQYINQHHQQSGRIGPNIHHQKTSPYIRQTLDDAQPQHQQQQQIQHLEYRQHQHQYQYFNSAPQQQHPQQQHLQQQHPQQQHPQQQQHPLLARQQEMNNRVNHAFNHNSTGTMHGMWDGSRGRGRGGRGGSGNRGRGGTRGRGRVGGTGGRHY